MNKTPAEPPGARQLAKQVEKQNRRSNVIPLPKQRISRILPSLTGDVYPARSFQSIEAMVHEMRPSMPVYCLRPHTIAATAKRFIRQFPGDVMYAVKCNPDPRVIRYLVQAGVRHFDVASVAEVRLIADLAPHAELYYMHPVKSRESIAIAYYQYGVRHFSLDCMEELQKILEVTNHAPDLNLFVRLAIPNDTAAYSLAGKYGVALDNALSLLYAARAASNRLGVCFHVGSQCMQPEAYERAIHRVGKLIDESGITLDVLDIGGGFPSIYPGMTPPSLPNYMKAIRRALKTLPPSLAQCQVVCEPGRALVAEGGSTVARVDLRRGNMLYLNEGTYGSLFDAGTPGFIYPVKAIRPGASEAHGLSAELAEFGFFGPTCDSMDVMKGPFHLPANIEEGDWIEIGQLGAYGATMRTNFNGFQSDTVVEVEDKPLLSMLEVN